MTNPGTATGTAAHGAYVHTIRLGVRGRVTAVHDGCPHDAAWVRAQSGLTGEHRHGRGRWLTVLLDGGGSVCVPDDGVRPTAPFRLHHPDALWHFPP